MEGQGSTSRRKSSTSCVKPRSCWLTAERFRMRVAGLVSLSRATTADARNLAALRLLGPAEKRTGEGERPVVQGGIGADVGQADTSGSFAEKLLSPARRRRSTDHARRMMPVFEQQICRVLGQNRSTQRKAARGADDETALTEGSSLWLGNMVALAIGGRRFCCARPVDM